MNSRSYSLGTNSLFTTTLLSSASSYFIQEWNLPGISINHQTESTKVGIINLQGDINEYAPLDLKLIVDEDLLLWKEIVQVFQKYQIPGTNQCEPITGESFIELYDSKNKYLFKVVFHNCYFKNLGDLRYMTTDDNEIITVDLSIVYDYYTIE
jgi:hypothetical protein